MAFKLESTWLKSKYTEIMSEQLGKGGFGTVYSFVDPNTKTSKALKLIKRDQNEEKNKWFADAQTEIENMLILNDCEFVLKLLDQYVDVKNDRVFLITELAAGSMEKISKKLSESELISFANLLLKSLHFAHEKKIVHRDLKPANILITHSGKYLIADWGISQNLPAQGTVTHKFTVKGTPGWAAPEFYDINEKSIDRVDLYKIDVYAAGLVLLFAAGASEKEITGGIRTINKETHSADIRGLIQNYVSYPGFDNLILRMLAFYPKERPNIAEALKIFQSFSNFDYFVKTFFNHSSIRIIHFI